MRDGEEAARGGGSQEDVMKVIMEAEKINIQKGRRWKSKEMETKKQKKGGMGTIHNVGEEGKRGKVETGKKERLRWTEGHREGKEDTEMERQRCEG